MTAGIPDAVVEAALNEWQTEHDPRRLPHRAAAFLAGFAAAEGPWREHLAMQIEALPTMEPVLDKDGVEVPGLSSMVPPFRFKEQVMSIVRGTNEPE